MNEIFVCVGKYTGHTGPLAKLEGSDILVSNYGRLFIGEKDLTRYKGKSKNYVRYSFLEDHYLHRTIAKLFIPNPDNKTHIDHIDGNRWNNKADNLRRCTAMENSNNPITKMRISAAITGIKRGPMSDEQKLIRSIAGKGRIVSDETRQKLSKVLRGRLVSETSRKNYSVAQKAIAANMTPEERKAYYGHNRKKR